MEFLKLHRRKSRISDVAYIALNIGLVIALLLITLSTKSIWLPLILVIVSKWRVLAVRPRFWWPNILANAVDMAVGVSHVIFLQAANGSVVLQSALSIGFAIWLLFVKPRSRHIFVTAQAGTALFVGTTALSMVLYRYDVAFFVLAMAALAYVTARHVLLHYEIAVVGTYTWAWTLFVAELAWFAHHWLFTYTLPGLQDIRLSQLAIIVTIFGFAAERALASQHKHGNVRRADMIVPGIFASILIVLLLTVFNQLNVTSTL